MTVVPPADPSPSAPGVPAGWYPDPASGRPRWWTGAAWTDDYAPVAIPRPSNALAIAALVVSIVGFLAAAAMLRSLTALGWHALAVAAPFVILALVLGGLGVARARVIRRGRGLAITALVLAGLTLALVATRFVG